MLILMKKKKKIKQNIVQYENSELNLRCHNERIYYNSYIMEDAIYIIIYNL